MTMHRHLILNLDRTIKVVSIEEGDTEAFRKVTGDWCDFTTIYKDRYYIMSIAVDDNGLNKNLPVNALASGLRGVFVLQSHPLVGPAVLCAANAFGESVDVPQDWIDLVNAIRKVVRSA